MANSLSQYKCPNCGATIPFDPDSQKLTCKYCDTSFEIESLEAAKAEEKIVDDRYDWDDYQPEKLEDSDQITYVCPECGGEVIGDQNMSACQCPYCGNSIIVAKQFEGMLKPDFIVPFKLTMDDAKKAFADHLKGKKFLAKNFESEVVIEKLNGLYVPYWLFDCTCMASARYKASRSRRYRRGNYEITETDHFMVFRDGSIDFENVPVDASSKLDDTLMESLEPYDFKESVDFNTAYLSGFFSDRYDDTASKAIIRANERIKNTTKSAIASTVVGFESVIETSSSVNFSSGKISYALLPIYIFSSKYRDKVYTFAMNGQTGKFAGDLPADKSKAFTGFVVNFVISFAIVFAIMMAGKLL